MRFPIPADVRLLPAGPVQGDDQRPAVNGGAGTGAGHEDLPWVWALDEPHPTRGFLPFEQSARHDVLPEYA